MAPREDYVDAVTGKTIRRVTTGDIYWGSVPFIVIQILMVALVLLVPGVVTHYKHGEVLLDDAEIEFGMDDPFGYDEYGFDDEGDNSPFY